MLGTAVPEAAVDEDNNALASEDDIAPSAKRRLHPEVHPVSITQGVEAPADLQLERRVPSPLTLHSPADHVVEWLGHQLGHRADVRFQRGDEARGPPETALLVSISEASRRCQAQGLGTIPVQHAIESQPLRDNERPLTELPGLSEAANARGRLWPATGEDEW